MIPDLHYSLNLERAVLGVCLLEKTGFGRIYSMIEAETFYFAAHQQIFDTIKGMYTNGIPVDIFTVTDQLMRVQGRDKINQDNTDYFVSQLTNSVTSGAHIEYHAYIIKSMWMEREILRLTSGGANLEGDARKKIADLQSILSDLQQRTTEHDWADMSSLMVSLYQHQEEMKLTGGMGLPTGIPEIDHHNGGFHPGQMIVIGARPSVGKSALIGGMAIDMARQGKKVGIISLEMGNTEIAARLAAIDTQTDFNVLFRGLYQDEAQTQAVYQRIGNHTSTLPIYVSDKTNVSVTEIRSKVDKLKSLHGVDIIYIDYLQLISVDEAKGKTRENEIAKVSRYCKIMAKELHIPIVLLCQLNRDITKRTGDARFPVLSDLRESGSIEQDADVVMFLHRDFMSGVETNEHGDSTEYEADLVVRKWRNGANNFMVKMDFVPKRMLFVPRSLTY